MDCRSVSAALLAFVALLPCFVSSVAQANPVGVQIYVDAWSPLHPADASFQTYYSNSSIISDDITDAWENARGDATTDIEKTMTEHDIGGGFRTYDAVVVLNPISSFSIAPSTSGGAVVQF